MAKQIIWSIKADSDRTRIFKCWNNRNKSSLFSIRLNKLFNRAVELLADHSSIGRPSSIPNIRIKVVKEYLIIYEESPDLIIVLTILDSRNNPDQLKKFTK